MATETKPLNSIDFMMMDVHRELDQEDADPETLVDKSLGAEQAQDDHDPGVGVSYPYETPLPPNVTVLPTETSHDLTAEHILRSAFDAKLTEMVVCGTDDEGHEWVLHTACDPATSVWHLQRAIHILNLRCDRRMMERYGQNLDDHPNPSA